MRFQLLLTVLSLICATSGFSQVPKREFRAVWVATVANIDWPSKQGLSTAEQQEEVIRILNHHKKSGMNAIILQVRPAADAIYNSSLEPWSRYLSGTQGVQPEPYYDPLKFWIDEAHERGMELHAWFNPYRIKQHLSDSLAEDHIIHKHPEWAFEYGDRLYFAPDRPEVWEFVKNVVVEVVRNYDIDAIHFDDYFYPYKIAGAEIPDEIAFKERGGIFYPDRKAEWRRQNVDTIIQILSDAIKTEKPWVKFGISPFGVWRNRTEDPRGSETGAGTTNYDALFADVLKWQQEGWIDYLMPQLYWRDDHPVADFSTLAYWWADQDYGRAMYYGLAPYRIDRKSDYKLWRRKRHFFEQIELIRTLQPVDGFGFFSSKHFFRKDLRSFDRKLSRKYMENIALVPRMPWIDNVAPEMPTGLRREQNRIYWDPPADTIEMNQGRFFVVYRYDRNAIRMLKRPENIIEITGNNYIDFPDDRIPEGIYRVSALDRLYNESQLSDTLKIEKKSLLNRILE